MNPERLTVGMPEYIPPVVIAKDAERWIWLAGQLIHTWAKRDAQILATAHYEDRPDPADSCIVLSIVARKCGAHSGPEVQCNWLEDIGMVSDELLSRSVGLEVHASTDSLVFDFRLPVHCQGTRRVVHRDTILLVEDDSYVLRASKEVLELSGYRVIAETSAEDALRACEKHGNSICLVISDVTLPKQSGKQLAQKLHASMPKIPILLISGYSEMECEDRMRRVFFLAKPFNSGALIGAAKQCLFSNSSSSIGATGESATPEHSTVWC
jgi:CheY-like chemotaxis protein